MPNSQLSSLPSYVRHCNALQLWAGLCCLLFDSFPILNVLLFSITHKHSVEMLLLRTLNDDLLASRSAANQTNHCHDDGDGLGGQYRHHTSPSRSKSITWPKSRLGSWDVTFWCLLKRGWCGVQWSNPKPPRARDVDHDVFDERATWGGSVASITSSSEVSNDERSNERVFWLVTKNVTLTSPVLF